MARYVALLRGINLGRERRVGMADLREALAEAGFEDVRTLGQSGNVAVTTPKAAGTVRKAMEQAIRERFGFDTDVILRTPDELAAVIEANPLGDVATDPKRLQVHFLSGEPAAAAVRELEAADVAPERIAVAGREIHVWHANGIQRSPAAKLLARADLGVSATARNWSTVGKLLALAEGEPSSLPR
jgi:uncharacterized protein (DUF1697 family)